MLVLYLACVLTALGTGVLAGLSDYRGMTIPNLYSVIIMAAFALAFVLLALFGPGYVFFGLASHLLAGILVFGVTVALFAARVIGAADSKLASAYALWVGIPGLPAFLFYTALAGGVLALAALALGKWKFVRSPVAGSWVARAQGGESKVPYGIAIAVGALASFVKLGYLGRGTLTTFLGL